MPTTLKDIAEELNVSVNTVSRALRDMPDIGQETTGLVKETALRLGYRKNLAASYLKTAKSMMLGILVPDICNPVFSYMYKGIEMVCNETGYTLMLGNSNGDPDKEDAIVQNMLDHGVDGIFLVPGMKNSHVMEQLEKVNIPYVILQRRFPGIEANIVQSSDYEGGLLAAKHLYELGHRRFLYISAPMYISSAKERYDGFSAYLEQRGMGVAAALEVLECESTRKGGYEAAKNWLQKQGYFQDRHSAGCALSATAIFCFSDYMAYGVYSAIAEATLQVPEDISVIGYDNNEYSDMTYPPLTTVDIFPYEIGFRSAKIMFDLLADQRRENNPDGDNRWIEEVMLPKLIVRESTKERRDSVWNNIQ